MPHALKKIFKKVIVSILTLEARLVLARFEPRVVAITGSVGKTSTKDAVFSVLSEFYYIRKSEKSFNSELGIPLTILGLSNAWNNPREWLVNIFKGALVPFLGRYPAWLVLEVGADRPGDIQKVSSWLKSDIVIMTRLAKVPVHVEFFESPEHVRKEKSYLVSSLKEGGTLLLNADDEDVREFGKLTRNPILTYGFVPEAYVRASHADIYYEGEGENRVPQGIAFKLNYEGSSVPIRLLGTLGMHIVYPALAAFSVGVALNHSVLEVATTLERHISPPGRMRAVAGIKKTTLIDDSYNSSPIALKEALATLNEIKVSGRKYAVLGDMMELGKFSNEEHIKAGEIASHVADVLVTVGLRARGIAEGALMKGMDEGAILQFEESREAGLYLQNIIRPGDIILVKGSQSVRMEHVVEELMSHPEESDKLLVRQDKEWKVR